MKNKPGSKRKRPDVNPITGQPEQTPSKPETPTPKRTAGTMAPQIFKLSSTKECDQNPLYNALKDPNKKHQRIKKISKINKDSDLIVFGPCTGNRFKELCNTTGSLENAADRYIFFPDQQIKDAEAKSIADRAGRKVLFNGPGAQCMVGLKTNHFVCTSTTKDGTSMPFRCARPNVPTITNDAYTHEIPHDKKLNFDPNVDGEDNGWGQFIDIEDESNNLIPQERYRLLATPTVERIPKSPTESKTQNPALPPQRQCTIS